MRKTTAIPPRGRGTPSVTRQRHDTPDQPDSSVTDPYDVSTAGSRTASAPNRQGSGVPNPHDASTPDRQDSNVPNPHGASSFRQHGPSTPADWDARLAPTRPMAIIARRRLGDSGVNVYPLALGGAVFGWTADDDTSLAVLDRFAELGGELIDTADSYAGGRSEVIIGNWMRTRRNRDDIVVATKIGRSPDNPGLGQISIVRAVEASLRRLQTDHIDLLFFHDDDPGVRLEDSLATAEWLIETGKVRHLGASNYSADRLMEARILSSSGLPKFVAMQSEYNLMHRQAFEHAPLIVASAQDLAVMPHSALAGGYLTGKYRRRSVGSGVRARAAARLTGRRGARVLAALDRIAADHGRQTTSVALAWLLAKRSVVAPVASASAPAQVTALMDAAGIRLTRGQMVELDRASEER